MTPGGSTDQGQYPVWSMNLVWSAWVKPFVRRTYGAAEVGRPNEKHWPLVIGRHNADILHDRAVALCPHVGRTKRSKQQPGPKKRREVQFK